ncbi:ABC transporter ATP-binding protein/permease [Cylindrospermopsis raciborskii]|uniref:ABC transporter ATP-binding protein n=1 Tax=Cylindrospermopsis raciborskii CENA303 TaxID=1170769 RepID=A0A1X4GIY7_9CYAN|nr:ABC transporter ATP-binding protein/permease [Cylindrospermopsis raciborskii]MCZ2203131.1 ABC transporter ATP-binding protein/permease [Cylindrospermopsis raciborskii PAMP2012]MCZ2205817.1 ABC transporter ATP-binding protein/permease [Cylindrospermopsis raciborskii PAMP2011]OSO97124.1 ABC transporter ATP-binding protein [Cylindrospermopsis raciborskii CENA303]
MNKIKPKAILQFWAIAKLYWLEGEKRPAIILLLLMGVLLLANTQLKVFLNGIQGDLISALSSKDSDRFWQGIVIAFAGIVIFGFLNSAYGYLRETINVYWRRWLTYHFLSQYFRDRAFYELNNFDKEIDNPDQRISEDIANFCQQSVQFLVNCLESVFVVLAFSFILWSISPNLVLVLIIYSILAYTITISFYGKKLTRLNIEQLRKEADFRFSLIRIRENSESIAFYNGIFQESSKVKLIFNLAFKNFQKLILWSEIYLNIFKYQFGYLPWIIPALILGNQVISGDIEVGKVTEAGGAFGQVAFSVNLIMYQFEKFTKFAAAINRLYVFHEYFQNPRKTNSDLGNIQIIKDNYLGFRNLTLYTPNYEKILFENFSLELQPGQSLLIMGDSGCGKSSLLRALAGLWKSGTGTIVRPDLSEILFLPQRPYMILGTLTEQLIYPYNYTDIKEERLYEVIEKVGLSYLTERFGGLNTQQEWSEILSLGEQQRLAFGRFLVAKPKYVILDEATSALDINNEEKLYNFLREMSTTFVSVGHRPTLRKFHQVVINLSGESL